MVLNRCILNGLITISDVELIYGFSNAKRYYSTSIKKALLVLEKLQLYGLISKVPDRVPYAWILTEKGRAFLSEALK